MQQSVPLRYPAKFFIFRNPGRCSCAWRDNNYFRSHSYPMLRILLSLLCCGLALPAAGQSYILYQQYFNRADNDIVAGDFRTALQRLDTVGRQYAFIYARHCIKGLQLAVRSNDSARARYWLERAFLQGVPPWIIRRNSITRQALGWPSVGLVLTRYDSLHALHTRRIDTGLAHRIDALMRRDVRYTRRVNEGFFLFRHTLYGLQWIRNNTRQIRELGALTARYGFPEERLIGLPPDIYDSAAMARPLQRMGAGLAVQNRQAFFMYLHYFSTRRPDANALLLPQVSPGNLPAYQYARLNEYLAANTSSGRYPRYHESQAIRPGEDTAGLDQRRAAIGLPPYAEGARNARLKLEREFAGRADQEVILE